MGRGWSSCGPLAATGGAIGLSGIILAVVTGCVYALVTEIDDLRLEGIDHVAVTKLETEDGNWYKQVDGPGDLLRIRLSTRDSLTDAINLRGLDHARTDIFFCDEGPGEREINPADFWVYAGGDRMRLVNKGHNELDVPRPEDGRYTYSIFVSKAAPIFKTEYVNGQRPQVGTVDIEKPVKPVCVQIYVPQYLFGKTIITNVVALQEWKDVMSVDQE
jgi:hypothetical protein